MRNLLPLDQYVSEALDQLRLRLTRLGAVCPDAVASCPSEA